MSGDEVHRQKEILCLMETFPGSPWHFKASVPDFSCRFPESHNTFLYQIQLTDGETTSERSGYLLKITELQTFKEIGI